MSDREKLLQSAQKWVDKKRYDRAVDDYLKVVQLDPKDMRTLLKVGDLQTRIQAYDQAIATYDRVGQFYAEQGFALKAIAVYKQIREVIRKHSPQLTDRYAYIVPKLAEIYTQLGLTSDALAAWDEVAARYQRGNLDRDAIEVFQKMVSLDSTNPLPYLRLAEACCRVQDLEEAIEAFWTAAELLLQLERREDALKVIERILHFKAEPKYARMAAQLYLQKGRREDGLQALAKLQIAFQVDPRDLDTLGLLAQAFTLIGQADKAIEVYKEMARIARESDRQDLFDQLVAHLQAVAPDDEGVRALLALAPSIPPEGHEPSSVHVDDEDVEIIAEDHQEEEAIEEIEPDEDASSEAPFALQRQSRPPAGRPFMGSAPDVMVAESDLEISDRYSGAEFDAEAHVKKALVDSEAFRKLRLYSKALETLQIAIEVNPSSIDVREKLRELLLESGDRDAAIGESVTLAAIYLERNDLERAEMLLYDVLDSEPQHPVALELLAQLQSGGSPQQAWSADSPTETVNIDYSEEQASVEVGQVAAAAWEEYPSRGPLPSYDLEEVSASSVMGSPHSLPDPNDAFTMDDPFAVQSAPDATAPLPSFPLGNEDDLLSAEEEAAYIDEPEYIDPEPDDAYVGAEAETDGGVFDDAYPTAAGDGPLNHEAIEEALEEAEFFASRGLYDDARTIIADQLVRAPGHPLLVERMTEIEEFLGGGSEQVAVARVSVAAPGVVHSEPEDRSFDIAASLEALDSLEPSAPPAAAPSNLSDQDVDQVFEKFKAGIRAQVSENDSATHYDLGVAYKEMGLLADAINEFGLAARDPSRECMCYAMIGMIRLERGELDLSAKAYLRGLEAAQKTPDQEMALHYDLGNVHEMKGVAKDALYYFEKVAKKDPRYRGVTDRIAALQPGARPASGTRSVNEEEDFDRVFDDLFESKG
ncbi:MAG: tetratricopeptide repeat protein [Myxococcales bacterium]|nr:tetratricopeptide repeat protein [Myxococcales bacterium]